MAKIILIILAALAALGGSFWAGFAVSERGHDVTDAGAQATINGLIIANDQHREADRREREQREKRDLERRSELEGITSDLSGAGQNLGTTADKLRHAIAIVDRLYEYFEKYGD